MPSLVDCRFWHQRFIKPFILAQVPPPPPSPGVSAVHYMQSSKGCSYSGGVWNLARNARTIPDFLTCSKRSDSGERCEVKKAMKSRGGLAFIFWRSFLLRTAPHYLNAWNRLRTSNPYKDFAFLPWFIFDVPRPRT